jgi:hypothetical protein
MTDLGYPGRRVGHELEDHGLKRRLVAPTMGIGLEPEEGVALILVDHIGARADRLLLEAFRADFLVIGLGQHVAGKERHPHEEGRLEADGVCSNPIAVDLVIAGGRPDEGNGIGAVFLAGALERPDDILRSQRRAVLPLDVLSNVHPELRLVVAPARQAVRIPGLSVRSGDCPIY